MKTKMNFKKILVSIGLLAVAVPSALSVVACGGVHKIVDKSQLNTIVTETDLGNLSNNQKATILAAVVAENPLADGKIDIKDDSITDTSAVVIPLDENVYTGTVPVTFIITPEAPNLDTIVTETDLGDLSDIDALTILEAVENKNPNAVAKVQVDEQSITTKDAKVIPKTDEYSGFVTVNFYFESKAPFLGTIITNRNLGTLVDAKPNTVLKRIVDLNSAAVNKIRVKSVDQEKNLATIVAIDPREYQGSVDVSFSLGELTEQDVVNAISLAPYFRVVLINSKVDDLVDANFIKQNIANQVIKNFFKDELFHLNRIAKDDSNRLTDADLKNPTLRIQTTINYNYGAIADQNVSLTIEVKESTLPIAIREIYLEELKDAEVGTPKRAQAWKNYLWALRIEFSDIVLDFTNKELSNEQMIQTIIHEQFKLVIEADLLSYKIEKDYDPWSFEFDTLKFYLIQDQDNKKIIEILNVVIEILQGDSYVPINLEIFPIHFSYNLIDEKA